jgi:hypothetical protein
MTVIIFAKEFCDERSVYLLDIEDEYNSHPLRSSCP